MKKRGFNLHGSMQVTKKGGLSQKKGVLNIHGGVLNQKRGGLTFMGVCKSKEAITSGAETAAHVRV